MLTFCQQIFIECLLCVIHCPRCWKGKELSTGLSASHIKVFINFSRNSIDDNNNINTNNLSNTVHCTVLRALCVLIQQTWDSPGGPVAKTACFQCRGPGFDPWSGN